MAVIDDLLNLLSLSFLKELLRHLDQNNIFLDKKIKKTLIAIEIQTQLEEILDLEEREKDTFKKMRNFWDGIRAYVEGEHENFIKSLLTLYSEKAFRFLDLISSLEILITGIVQTQKRIALIDEGILKANQVVDRYYENLVQSITHAPYPIIAELRDKPELEARIKNTISNIVKGHQLSHYPLHGLREKLSEANLREIAKEICLDMDVYTTKPIMDWVSKWSADILNSPTLTSSFQNAVRAEGVRNELLVLRKEEESLLKVQMNELKSMQSDKAVDSKFHSSPQDAGDALEKIKSLNNLIDREPGNPNDERGAVKLEEKSIGSLKEVVRNQASDEEYTKQIGPRN